MFPIQKVGETGASSIQGANCYRVILRKHSAQMDIPSTVVGWTSTSRHTVQTSGVKKTKLTRCGQKLFCFGYAHIISSQTATS